ncbi:MAG: sporulation membrane protein YtaF [Clostridia bacterium]
MEWTTVNSVASVIMIALAVSIDGFWGGFAFGLRKIKITFSSLVLISSWSVICTMIAMLIGYYLKGYISMEAAKYIGAALLLFLGIYTLKEGYSSKNEVSVQKDKCQIQHEEKNIKVNLSINELVKVLRNPLRADIDNQNDIKPIEGTILGLAVAMDASIAAFTLSLFGFNPFITPFLFGVTHFILIGLGNIIARQNIINDFADKLSMLPGLILVAMALFRMV